MPKSHIRAVTTHDNKGRTRGWVAKYFSEIVLRFSEEDCLIWPHARDPNGYAVMSRNGRRWLVHRAACTIIHGRPPSKHHDAAHRCGNGHFGCVNPRHLRWATRRENQADRLLHGTHGRGERCGVAKLTESDVRKIRSAKGQKQRELAMEFGVSQTTISEIKSRKKWHWLE